MQPCRRHLPLQGLELLMLAGQLLIITRSPYLRGVWYVSYQTKSSNTRPGRSGAEKKSEGGWTGMGGKLRYVVDRTKTTGRIAYLVRG
jgi:hypothetical protein